MYARERDERGSTIPLILGFFLVAMLVVAGAICAGDAAMDQSELQSRCDAAAVGIAASAIDTGRDGGSGSVHFDPAAVRRTVAAYLARDPARADLKISTSLSPDDLTVGLNCAEPIPLAFGSMIGRPAVTHNAASFARAPATLD